MKFFLDCGAYDGSSVRLFRERYPDWKEWQIHCWEPNPVHAHKLSELDWVILHERAVWIRGGEVPFYLHKGGRLKAASIIETKPDLDLERPIIVPCLDFSSWLNKCFTKDDYIVLKMDIEGAEYRVLIKMIEDDSISLVDELYIEFHGHKTGVAPEVHNALVADLKARGLESKTWCQ